MPNWKPGEFYLHHQVLSAVVSFFERQHRQAGGEEHKDIMEIFLKKFNYFSDVYNSLADEEKAWVLKYLFAGKGVI